MEGNRLRHPLPRNARRLLTIRCKQCQTENLPEANYCQKCGYCLHSRKLRVRRWLRRGLIAATVILGLFLLIGAWIAPRQKRMKNLDIQVSLPTAAKVSEAVELKVLVENRGKGTVPISGIILRGDLHPIKEKFDYLAGEPPFYKIIETTIYYPQSSLEPAAKMEFKLHLIPQQAGDFQGTLAIKTSLFEETEGKEITLEVKK